ncbi:molybdopterin-dependent oxidoreductase [Pelobacter seleniigenes]|uniref:molybdopterin-dependent oxidoreductase n=1 Tax=Pelobacter seleniigenes TaxID=407188 RepID=UPI00068E666F|nr:molybdopterin-dependent oxidoreductase [Pelobacter seleniigenes]
MSSEPGKNRFIARRRRKANCRLCSYLCGIEVFSEGNKIVKIKPDPERYPYNEGIVNGCRRFHSNVEFLYHPERINYPLKRKGERGSGQWQQISWEDALDEIAERLLELKAQFGGETLATSIGGPHTTFWPLHRFLNLFGSPNNMGIGQICWNPSIWVNSLTFGWPLENEIDPETTECLILWGVNPAESDNSLFWRTVLAYSRTGKPLIVVDPRRTRTAALATQWLAPRPGSDAALALGLLQVIINEQLIDAAFIEQWCHGFSQLRDRVRAYTPTHTAELTGIPAAQIIAAARSYGQARPASIFHGRGIDQIGANSMQVHRGIACLKGVTGNVDRRGASLVSERPDYIPEIDLELTERLSAEQRSKQLGRERILLQSYAGYERLTQETMKHGKRLPARYLTSAQPNLVWRAMLNGVPYPIRAMIVSGSNPLLSQADSRLIERALRNLELSVSLELFHNPVTALSDYVLPMAGSLERPVLQTNAGVANLAYGGPAAIEPLFERRTDFAFWRDLGIRCGQNREWPWQTFTDSLEDIVAPLGMDWAGFCQTGLYCPPPSYGKHEQLQQAGQPGFATVSGKVELYSELLAELGAEPLPQHQACAKPTAEFPLTLISGGRKQPYWASSFRQLQTLKKNNQQPEAEISLETASDLGFVDGQEVYVETARGRAKFTLKICAMKEQVVNVDYGWWFPDQDLTEPHLGGLFEANANLLTQADIEDADPLLGQWKYNDIPCRIYPVDSEKSDLSENCSLSEA